MNNKANKAVSKAMRQKAEEALTELNNCPNGMLRLEKRLKTDSKEVEGGRCMRGSDGKPCIREKERGKVWKNYMERITSDENDRDRNVEGDAVVCVSGYDVLQALNKMITGKDPEPS